MYPSLIAMATQRLMLSLLAQLSRMFVGFLFFFSSRRRHTRLTCDWSSDVCSSDLQQVEPDRPHDAAPDVLGQSLADAQVERDRDAEEPEDPARGAGGKALGAPVQDRKSVV